MAALLGVIAGGIITSVSKWLELKYMRRRQLSDLKIARLEDLHARLATLALQITPLVDKLGQLGFGEMDPLERGRTSIGLLSSLLLEPSARISAELALHTDIDPDPIMQQMLKIQTANQDFLDLARSVPVAEQPAKFVELVNSLSQMSTVCLNLQTEVTEQLQSLLRA